MNIVIFLRLYPGWSVSDVKLYEYCDILMFVSRMVSVMSNCMNIVIFLCLHPGWSLCDVKLYEYCDILICIKDGLSVMSNCMNIDILMFVSRMVSQ